MRVQFYFVILGLVAFSACYWPFGSDAAVEALSQNDLYQHWVHSREEDDGNGVQVFRPAGSREFPPSWFRMEYVFREDGSCSWLFLAPDDGHHLRKGNWQRDGDRLQVQHGDVPVSYDIVELRREALLLRPN